jgi:methylmalonyl-CoA/ethylmalonyl-CoA epimerase
MSTDVKLEEKPATRSAAKPAGKRKAKIARLHHVTLRVPDLDKAVAQWTNTFGEPPERYDLKEEWGYKMAFFNAGNCHIVLFQDFGHVSINETHDRVMKESGPTDYGFFHMAFHTEDIDGMVKEMGEAGVDVWDKQPQVEGYGGSRYSWLNPKDTADTLVHLYEAKW